MLFHQVRFSQQLNQLQQQQKVNQLSIRIFYPINKYFIKFSNIHLLKYNELLLFNLVKESLYYHRFLKFLKQNLVFIILLKLQIESSFGFYFLINHLKLFNIIQSQINIGILSIINIKYSKPLKQKIKILKFIQIKKYKILKLIEIQNIQIHSKINKIFKIQNFYNYKSQVGLKMSIQKQKIFQKPQQPTIPLLKAVPHRKYTNNQRLKQIYQPTSKNNKNETKQKYYLPKTDRYHKDDYQQKESLRYKNYLDAQLNKNKQRNLSYQKDIAIKRKAFRYSNNKSRNQQQSQQNMIQIQPINNNRYFKVQAQHKLSHQLPHSNKNSTQNIQSQQKHNKLNKLQKIDYSISGLTGPNTSRFNANSYHQQNSYSNQKQSFYIKQSLNIKQSFNIKEPSNIKQSFNIKEPSNIKQSSNIRRSTKKSFSGSLSKKPSGDISIVRQDTKFERVASNTSNQATPVYQNKNDLLQQGKLLFKKGLLKQALQCLSSGLQSFPKLKVHFLYHISLIHLRQHNYQQGLITLQSIISYQPTYKRTVYLFAAISQKHLGNLTQAIQYANKGLQLFNHFVDLIFYRAKIYKEIHNIDMAIRDFQTVIKHQKDHVQALYLLAFLYYQKLLFTHFISSLSSAIYYDQDKSSQYKHEALKLRAKYYLSQGKIKQAKRDIQKIKLQSSKSNAQIYYLLGKIQIQQSCANQALINFQRCLRESNKSSTQPVQSLLLSSTSTSVSQAIMLSLIQISKTKIQIKDFYSAYHHISRIKHFNIQQNNLNIKQDNLNIKQDNLNIKQDNLNIKQDNLNIKQDNLNIKQDNLNIKQNNLKFLRYKNFIQGVVFLMKRKVNQGMNNFINFQSTQNQIKSSLKNIKNQVEIKQTIKDIQYFYPMFYLYRAFGYFMQNQHHKAIQDYQQYETYVTLDKYTLYNLLLAKGITKIRNQDFQSAKDYFSKSQQLFINSTIKVQPFIYRAMASIQQAKYLLKKDKQPIIKDKQLIVIQKATKKQKSHKKPIKQQKKTQQDIDIQVLQLVFNGLKQLDRAYQHNQNNSNLLFIRSLVYSYLNKYQQALDDIIKAISKSQENVAKYFFIRAMIQSTLNNKKQAVNDFNICVNLTDAQQNHIINNSDNNNDNNNNDVTQNSNINNNNNHNYKNKNHNSNNKNKNNNNNSNIYSNKNKQYIYQPKSLNQQVYLQRAKLYFATQNYGKALEDLEKLRQINPNDDIQWYKACLYLVNGLYPLAEEAAQLVKNQQTNKFKQLTFHINLKNGKIRQAHQYILPQFDTDRVLLNIMSGDRSDLILKNSKQNFLGKMPQISLCKYFNLIHYHNLIGVGLFRQGYTSLALEQFSICLKQQNLHSMQQSASSFKAFDQSPSQSQISLIKYNIFLCYLQLNEYKKAYQIFVHDLVGNLHNNNAQFVDHFMHLLFKAIKKNTTQAQQQREDLHLQLFTNNVTDIFGQQIVIQTHPFVLKTKLCLLSVQYDKLKKQYSPKLHPQYILKWLDVCQVQNRPQPPWVKRQHSSDQGLIFTNHVQNINIQFQTTQHDQQQDEQKEQNSLDQQQYEEDNSGSQNQIDKTQDNQQTDKQQSRKKFDPSKFRDQMRLDDSIERKLNKIVNATKLL